MFKINGSEIRHNELVRWLKKRCEYSDCVYDDPGYSDYYRSWFKCIDISNEIYLKGDIDCQINNDIDISLSTNFSDSIEQYTDHVQIDDVKNMIVLPGSNHSNANYLYKIINNYMLHPHNNNTFHIPIVSNNPKQPFNDNSYKTMRMKIDKNLLYNYVYTYSKK